MKYKRYFILMGDVLPNDVKDSWESAIYEGLVNDVRIKDPSREGGESISEAYLRDRIREAIDSSWTEWGVNTIIYGP